jgi:hypothetical protein
MAVRFLRLPALVLASTLGLSACAYGDGYGYGGVSVGYGGGGYCDPYFDDCYGGGYGYNDPWYGWYDNYYYPGWGVFVYDQWRRPYRWSDNHRRYWEQRRSRWGNRDWNDQRWQRWDGWDRGDRREWRQDRGEWREDRREMRGNTREWRQERRGDRQEFRRERREDRGELRRGEVTRPEFRGPPPGSPRIPPRPAAGRARAEAREPPRPKGLSEELGNGDSIHLGTTGRRLSSTRPPNVYCPLPKRFLERVAKLVKLKPVERP